MAACWKTKLEKPMPLMPLTSVTTTVPSSVQEAVDAGHVAQAERR